MPLPPPPQRASLGRTIKAVAWSFVGLRQRGAYQEDMARLSPVHIIVVALVGVSIFVGALIVLVNWVAR